MQEEPRDLTTDLEELELLAKELEIREVERDLRKYIPLAWPIIEPHKPYIHSWHIDAIADHLMACTEGHIKKLVINIPPRHMKSLTVSVFWPSWEWIRFPQTKWMFVSYSRNLVIRDSVKTRRIISSDWYQQYWGDRFKFSTDQNVKSHYENNQGGARIVGSIESGITGEGGDRIVVDDPLKLEDAENQNAIFTANDFWDGVLASRLNDERKGIRVIIMQRLHENDLTGHVLKEGGWTHLYLPTKYEPSRACITVFKRTRYELQPKSDPETGEEQVVEVQKVTEEAFQDPRAKEGELLNPLRFGPEEVNAIELRNGSWKFAGQQQQNPFPKGGGAFKKKWWRYWIVAPTIEEALMEGAQSWDCSFKDLATSDYVAGLIGTRIGPEIFILDGFKNRLDFPSTVRIILEYKKKHPWTGAILVEDKANGPAVISVLKNKVPGVVARNPGPGGVEAVASAVTYLVEAGNVLLPGRYDGQGNIVPAFTWVQDLIDQAEAFPRGEYDDFVSALAQLLFYYHERQASEVDLGGMLGLGHEEAPPDAFGWEF